jgi:hypothetical protein
LFATLPAACRRVVEAGGIDWKTTCRWRRCAWRGNNGAPRLDWYIIPIAAASTHRQITAAWATVLLSFSMTEARSDLICDVGLYDGEDTAYYLSRGYNVVAIDANPMSERARLRFAPETVARHPTLLNVGVPETPGVTNFWISEVPEWSSCNSAAHGRLRVRGLSELRTNLRIRPELPQWIRFFSRTQRSMGRRHSQRLDAI